MEKDNKELLHSISILERLQEVAPLQQSCEATRRLYIDPILLAAARVSSRWACIADSHRGQGLGARKIDALARRAATIARSGGFRAPNVVNTIITSGDLQTLISWHKEACLW